MSSNENEEIEPEICAKIIETVKQVEREMVQVEDEKEWVFTDYKSEDDILRECWTNLPFNVDFKEFEHTMKDLRGEQIRKNSPWGRTEYMTSVMYSLWVYSGYASTLLTVASYREYLFTLCKWVIVYG